ncbi:MAG: hypothetical protein ACXVAN_06425 [Polyangia bacterium]
MRFLAAVVAAATLTACESFFAPYENPNRTVEGCSDAVKHLRDCCPAWDSYLSCTYLDHAIPSRDLTADQSRCLAKSTCGAIQHAVEGAHDLCGFTPATRHCR